MALPVDSFHLHSRAAILTARLNLALSFTLFFPLSPGAALLRFGWNPRIIIFDFLVPVSVQEQGVSSMSANADTGRYKLDSR